MSGRRPERARTKAGVALTDELLGRLAIEAERGFDPEQFRRPGRPRLTPGEGPSAIVQVRVDEDLHNRLSMRAADEGTTVSAVVRAALHEHLGATPSER